MPRNLSNGDPDESTRRRMLRWIKKAVGIHHPEGGPSDTHGRRRQSRPDQGQARARGIAPPGYNNRQRPENSSSSSRHGTRQRRESLHADANADAETSSTTSSKGGKVTILLYDEEELKRTLSNASSAPNSCRSDKSSSSSRRSQTSQRSVRSAQTTPTHAAAKRSIYEHHHQLPQYQYRTEPRVYDPNDVRVLIIGGGIGGLCLAQGLKKHGIPFTVFERDPSAHFRSQGYRLRINSAGYEALKATLSKESFEVFLRATGQFFPDFVHVDAHTTEQMPEADGATFFHDAELTKEVFSANRAMLRSLLLADLYEGSEIQYSMGFSKYRLLPNGRVEAVFENGDVVEGSVLVGADGTTSRVRRQYVPRHVTLLDTECGAIYGKTPISKEMRKLGLASDATTLITSQHPKMSLIVEPQCTTKLDLAYFPSAMYPNADDETELSGIHKYITWMLLARADVIQLDNQLTVEDLYTMTPEQIAELSTHLTSDWHPQLRAIVDAQAPEFGSFMRISTMAPEIRAWAPSPVTLVGDAVHTMAPAGIGCNAALEDARVLCDLFVRVGVNVEAIGEFEKTMRPRAYEGILASVDAGKRLYDLPSLTDMTVVPN